MPDPFDCPSIHVTCSNRKSAYWSREFLRRRRHSTCSLTQGLMVMESSLLWTLNLLPPPVALRPNTGSGLLIPDVSRSHTATHQIRWDSFGRVISSSQRPLPDNTQHLQQTNIHAPGGIGTHNLSRRAAADLRNRRRGHWDQPKASLPCSIEPTAR